MTARVGSKQRLAEVRAAAQIIDRTSAALATIQVLDAYPDQLRRLSAAQLAHEIDRLDVLPHTAAVAELLEDVEVEQAGRQWQRMHAVADLIGWAAAVRVHDYEVATGHYDRFQPAGAL
jgi:hypothetical protein